MRRRFSRRRRSRRGFRPRRKVFSRRRRGGTGRLRIGYRM